MSGIQAWDDTPSMEEQFGEVDMRVCTCHPDDNPPVPCQRKYALNDCRLAASSKGPASMREGDGVQEERNHAAHEAFWRSMRTKGKRGNVKHAIDAAARAAILSATKE